MKRLFMMVAAVCLFSINMFAADVNKELKVQGFSKLNVSYCFDVTVEKSENEYLSITIDEEYEPYLVAKVRDGVLYIGIDTDNLPKSLKRNNSNKTFIAKIGVRELERIVLSGATSFYSDEVFRANHFVGKFSGATNVKKLNVVAMKSNFGVSGASKLSLEGEITDCSIDISGSSQVSVNTNSKELDMDVSGASDITVNGVYGEVEIDCSGASNCYLSGKTVSLNMEGSGSCKMKAEDMVADYCEVDLSGASKGTVTAMRHLKVDLSGASKLVYNRDVAKLEVDDISSGASLKKR